MKKKTHTLLTSLAALTLVGTLSADAQRLFRDDFNGRRGSIQGNQWTKETHQQGRGNFGKDAWLDGNGVAHISVAKRAPGNANRFWQTAIKTKRTFQPAPGKTIDMRIRCKVNTNQKGIVFGFFTYSQGRYRNALRSNEIDFEWLTNNTSNRSKDTILISNWKDWNRDAPKYNIVNNGWHGTHQSVSKPFNADTNQWQTYTIAWKAGKLEFFRDNPSNGKWIYIGGYYGSAVTTAAQHLFVNGWVAESSWPQAFNGGLQPGGNQAYYTMLVDWVEVRQR